MGSSRMRPAARQLPAEGPWRPDPRPNWSWWGCVSRRRAWAIRPCRWWRPFWQWS